MSGTKHSFYYLSLTKLADESKDDTQMTKNVSEDFKFSWLMAHKYVYIIAKNY